jgi:hypothetical protein
VIQRASCTRLLQEAHPGIRIVAVDAVKNLQEIIAVQPQALLLNVAQRRASCRMQLSTSKSPASVSTRRRELTVSIVRCDTSLCRSTLPSEYVNTHRRSTSRTYANLRD